MLPGRGRSAASSATSASVACLANRARMSSGPVKTRARAWLIVCTRSARAVRLATIDARIASTVAALRGAAGAAGQGRPGGADRIERIGLACPPPVLPVGPVYLHHTHAGGGDVPGQPSAVTVSPFDAGQAHRAEPAQPAQQPG